MRVTLIWRKGDSLFVRSSGKGVVLGWTFSVLAAVLLAFAGVGWHLSGGPGDDAAQACLLIGGVLGGMFLLFALGTIALSPRAAVIGLERRTLKRGRAEVPLDDLRAVYLYSYTRRVSEMPNANIETTETRFCVGLAMGQVSINGTSSIKLILRNNVTEESLPSVMARFEEKHPGVFDGGLVRLVDMAAVTDLGEVLGRVRAVAETIAESLNVPLVETVEGNVELRLPGSFDVPFSERLSLEPESVEEPGPPPEGVEVHEDQGRLEVHWRSSLWFQLITLGVGGAGFGGGGVAALVYADEDLSWIFGGAAFTFAAVFFVVALRFLPKHGRQRLVVDGGGVCLERPWSWRQRIPLRELTAIERSPALPPYHGLVFQSSDRRVCCPMYPRTADWTKARVLSFLQSLSAERSETEVGPYR